MHPGHCYPKIMAKPMQQLWVNALFLLFLGGETKDYIDRTASIMKYGTHGKFSPELLFGSLQLRQIAV